MTPHDSLRANARRPRSKTGNGLFAAAVALTLLTPATAALAQDGGAWIHPLLAPLVEEPGAGITGLLKGEAGGFQGRHRLDGRPALSLHLRTKASREELETLGIRVRSTGGDRATVTLHPEVLAALAARPDVYSISLPRRLRPDLDRGVPETGVSFLRSQAGGHFSGRTGAGVVVGVIDSGIDVDHRNFRDAAGHTRILFALDQTAGNLECNAQEIDLGRCAIQDDPAALGHGTHVAGIAAGDGAADDENGVPFSYVGMAPEASLIFVKTTFMSDDIIDGLHYIFDQADKLGMPAVVNLSLGHHVGAHDGTDSMEEEIDALVQAQPGRVVVVAAGNQRLDGIHAELHAVGGASVSGPEIVVPPYTPNPGRANDFLIASGYYSASDDLTVQVFTPSAQTLSMSLSNNPNAACVGGSTADGFVVLCNTTASQLDQATGDREIILFVHDDTLAATPPAQGRWRFAFSGNQVQGEGRVNLWVQSNLGSGPTAARASFATHVSESRTVAMPGNSRSAVTVGAYTTKICWTANGEPVGYTNPPAHGDIAPFSSLGPTRDGRPKPSLVAPGMGVVSVLAEEVRSTAKMAVPNLVINDDYLLLQGTSMAAPHVAGAVALLLEADPVADYRRISRLLGLHAREDLFTEGADLLPWHPIFSLNYVFGLGKLDLGSWGFQDRYESNDTPYTARRTVSGVAIEALLEHADDLDHFFVAGSQVGDLVRAELVNLPADYRLTLIEDAPIDACGVIGPDVQAQVSDAGETQGESATGTQRSTAHPLWIRVDSSLGQFDPSLPYLLRPVLIKQEVSRPHGSIATAQELPELSEIEVLGMSQPFERDLYTFWAEGPVTVNAIVNPGLQLELFDARGNSLATGVGSLSYQPQGPAVTTWRPLSIQVQGVLTPNNPTAYRLALELVP